MDKKIVFELLWGLPGSGKTHYCKDMKTTGRYRSANNINYNKTGQICVDLDSYKSKNHVPKEYYKLCLQVIRDLGLYFDHIVIDGLFTENNIVKKLFTDLLVWYPKAEFHITIWNEDRETCLINDQGRREESSEASIKALPYETPDKDLKNNFNITKVNNMTVTKKEEWQIWAKKTFCTDGQYYESSTWCTGGSSGNCWNDNMYRVESSPQPEFDELDAVLEEKIPGLTFLQYKSILREAVEIETKDIPDYYGGCVGYAYYICDLRKLYEFLKDRDLI